MRKAILSLFILIIIALTAGPFAAGLWIQKNYHHLISFNRFEKNIHVEVVDYQRHWLSSDVTVMVSVDPDYLEKLFHTTSDLSAISKMTIEQHIQHGPVIYHPVKNISHWFGMAAIQNEILISPEMTAFLLLTGMPDLKMESESFISFFGNYFNHFKMNGFTLSDHENKNQTGIQNVIADIWIYPFWHRFNAEIKLNNSWVRDEDDSLEIPKMTIYLNQYLDKHDFWLGKGSMEISDILIKETGESDVRISDVNVEGFTEANNDLLNASRKINIKNIRYNNEWIGPVDIEVNLEKFNLLAMRDMWNAFLYFLENGEVYQGQLRQKITMLLPKIIGAGTSIRLDKFNLMSSNGKIIATGSFGWPENNFISPGNLRDVVMSGQARLNIKASKKMISALIQFASTIPDFVRDVAEPQKNILLNARNELEFAMQRNSIFIDYLSNHGYISKQAEDTLEEIQRNLIPMDEYTRIVRDLFLDRQIALIVSYQLCWQYAQIQKPYQFLQNKVTVFQDIAKKQIQEKFENLLKNGYVNVDHDEYSAEIKWSADQFTSNGREVK